MASILKSGQKPFISRSIRLEHGMAKWFDKNGINLSLACRDLLNEFMNMKNIHPKYYFERRSKRQDRYEN